MKNALITGITGQDGSYLTELLLSKGYQVYGASRTTIEEKPEHYKHIEHLLDKVEILKTDFSDDNSIGKHLKEKNITELYHFAAQSFAGGNFQQGLQDVFTNVGLTSNILNAVYREAPTCKVLLAGSAEAFGLSKTEQLAVHTQMLPSSLYGISKSVTLQMGNLYREAYQLFVCTAILFNHESKRRPRKFVTQKIVSSIKEIVAGELDCLELGNIEAQKDWGLATEYVEGMWQMLQMEQARDLILATGKYSKVKDWVDICFKLLGKEISWEGQAGTQDVTAKLIETGKTVVRINPDFFRPIDAVPCSIDLNQTKKAINWNPTDNLEAIIKELL